MSPTFLCACGLQIDNEGCSIVFNNSVIVRKTKACRWRIWTAVYIDIMKYSRRWKIVIMQEVLRDSVNNWKAHSSATCFSYVRAPFISLSPGNQRNRLENTPTKGKIGCDVHIGGVSRAAGWSWTWLEGRKNCEGTLLVMLVVVKWIHDWFWQLMLGVVVNWSENVSNCSIVAESILVKKMWTLFALLGETLETGLCFRACQHHLGVSNKLLLNVDVYCLRFCYLMLCTDDGRSQCAEDHWWNTWIV